MVPRGWPPNPSMKSCSSTKAVYPFIYIRLEMYMCNRDKGVMKLYDKLSAGTENEI